MRLKVLSVAYPFAPVRPETAGGAEQVLSMIDRGLVRKGHESVVVAREGSGTEGVLIPVSAVNGDIEGQKREAVYREVREALRKALRERDIDIVHMHGVDFSEYLPDDRPVLVTLHLPLSCYKPGSLFPKRPSVYFNCVSRTQALTSPEGMRLTGVIGNGVPVEIFSKRLSRRAFALSLGRICPEKGFHYAIEASKEAGVPFLLAGEVFPYEAHKYYYEHEIRPRLEKGRCRFIGPVGLSRKRRLLASARCLLVPSLAPETSSLSAMEALAAGTPVIAFPNGALPEIVEHGRTGFIVKDAAEMSEAIGRAHEISPRSCRQAAVARFSHLGMVEGYLEAYEKILEETASLKKARL